MRIGVITDLHLSTATPAPVDSWHNAYDIAAVPVRVRRAFSAFASEGVAAIAVLGDLTYGGDAAALDAVAALLAEGEAIAPVLAVAGNHDFGGSDDPLEGRQLDARPAHLGELRVKALDLAAPTRSRGLAPGAGAPGLRLVLSHFPILSRFDAVTAAGLRYSGDLDDRADVHDALAGDRVPTVVLCGHLHVRDVAADARILQLVCAALVEPPFEAALVDLDVAAGRVRRRVMPLDQVGRLRHDPRLAPLDVTWELDGVGWHALAEVETS